MAAPQPDVIARKLGFFRHYLHDLAAYAALDSDGRRWRPGGRARESLPVESQPFAAADD